jgi:hypothetical protein
VDVDCRRVEEEDLCISELFLLGLGRGGLQGRVNQEHATDFDLLKHLGSLVCRHI